MSVRSVQCKWCWRVPRADHTRHIPGGTLTLRLVNGVSFQLGWLVAVQGKLLPALLVTVSVLLLHWLLLSRAPREWAFILGVALLGYSIDSLLVWQGVYLVAGSELLAPVWLLCIWLMFATTLCHALAFLQWRLGLALLLGAIFAPLSYWLGSQLAPLAFSSLPLALALLVLVWSALLPAMSWWSRQVYADAH